jgi:magnesium transporter
MIRAWIVDGKGGREVTPEVATHCALAATGYVWIDFEAEEEASARAALAPLGIHPLVLDDMVGEVNRPKVDNYGDYLYLVVHSARWDDDRPQLRELDIVLGARFLITFHEESTRSVDAARDVVVRRPELLTKSPAYLLHFMLDVLVDHYLPIMDRITEEIDELEEVVFQNADLELHRKIVHIKRGLSALRRVVGPQRDTILALTRDEFAAMPGEVRPYLRDVYDRLARVSDLLDSFRDETATLLDLHVSVTSNQLNQVIKRLTVIATIGLPLTVVTSYYGMNFNFHEYHVAHPSLFIGGALVGTAFLTWLYLRWKRWL